MHRTPSPAPFGNGRQGGVPLHDGHRFERHIEFICRDLCQSCQHARAKIDLSGVDSDIALCIDGKEAIDRIERERLPRCRCSLRKRFN